MATAKPETKIVRKHARKVSRSALRIRLNRAVREVLVREGVDLGEVSGEISTGIRGAIDSGVDTLTDDELDALGDSIGKDTADFKSWVGECASSVADVHRKQPVPEVAKEDEDPREVAARNRKRFKKIKTKAFARPDALFKKKKKEE